jgi:phosphoribosylanthranilate isomerase
MTRIGVSHSTRAEELRSICAIRPDALQILPAAQIPPDCPARIIRMIGPADATLPKADFLIIDGSHGTGRSFNPDFASAVVMTAGVPVVLAGGLTPDTVGDAIRAVRPYGVDVASGVEYSPGKKDPGKVRAFVAAAREAGI